MLVGYEVLTTVVSLLGTIAIAIATVALWHVTRVLAKHTERMADASAQPQIIATIIPNIWSTIHLDINVENTGNASAFDIEIVFDPPLANGEARNAKDIPFQKISVLKPDQFLQSYLSGVSDYLDRSYEVFISWKLHPLSRERETLRYKLNMSDYKDVSYLGSRDPAVQTAEQIKKLREDWRDIANGSKKTGVDVYSKNDRNAENKEIERRFKSDKGSKLKGYFSQIINLVKSSGA